MVERRLIVNADDFGQSEGIVDGVARAHENGIVTSASLMVRWPSARRAAAYALEHPSLSVGLHLDLGEWSYRAGEWRPRYMVAPTDDAAAVRAETERQLDLFRRLLGRTPSHLDSHQHVHRHEPVRSVAREVTQALGIPLRHHSPYVRYEGSFYGQADKGEALPGAVGVEALIDLVRGLPPGTTELGCHPGDGTDVESMYAYERAHEVATLCDPRVRAALNEAGVELISFADVSAPATR
ncbi:MAG: ChbG/HpnK family deacetylase [Chloroflexi bacterium]|nr:ChbG/HpnK family deacetylase [Chloroflexota bacterium]HEV8054015.1 ChbG/HpnK family deacetylase [Candidatus Limnocylindrales bacterium]